MEFKIKIGDKCKIPKTKSVKSRYEESSAINNAKERNQDFLYYTGKSRTSENHMLWYEFDPNHKTGDHFLEHEIELYEEEFPEKWWIYPKTISEIEAVCKWCDENHSVSKDGFYLSRKTQTGYTNAFQKGNVYFEEKVREVTEITFDQFKKHILKESTIMKKEIKVGSKVKYKGKETVVVLESKSSSYWIIEYPNGWYGKDRSFKELDNDTRYWSVTDGDLTLIEETTMKNLLETEFVIENCTLSQRLAIKAYCDEKKIDYYPPSFQKIQLDAEGLIWTKTKFVGFDLRNYSGKNYYTFLELIQFLDKYQPEPEFKVGGVVVSLEKSDGYKIGEIIEIDSIINVDVTKCLVAKNKSINSTKALKFFRHATSEEIKKWKEENEIKLPRINQYDGKISGDSIVYGNNCAKLKISWFKNIGDVSSFLNIGENRTIRSIKLNSDVEITIANIEQIKKFIEHNKL